MIHKSDRVVIMGYGGMPGEAVYEVFKNMCEVRASDIDVNTPWLERLDVSSAPFLASCMGTFLTRIGVPLGSLTSPAK